MFCACTVGNRFRRKKNRKKWTNKNGDEVTGVGLLDIVVSQTWPYHFPFGAHKSVTFRHGLTAGCDEGEHVAMSRIGKTMGHPVAEKQCKTVLL